MITERKEKLIKYLFPSESIRRFMCNDLYMELIAIIPKSLFISTANKTLLKRKANKDIIIKKIEKFLKQNNQYYIMLIGFFLKSTEEEIINDIILGLTFFITTQSEAYKDIDIFNDKRSVCYSPISFLDIM